MTRALRCGYCLLVLVALLGFFAAASLVATSDAWARPSTLTESPDPTNGDPTGDDQPAPTPKPKNLAPSLSSRAGIDATDARAAVRVTGSWRWFLRYLRTFPLR